MSLHTMVAPDVPYHPAKFQFNTTLSKVVLTHVNSTYTPSWPKIHPCKLPHWLLQVHPPNIHAYKTLPKILIINWEILI